DYLLELADVLGARISCTHIQTDGADYWDKIELSFFEKLYQEEIERDRLAFFISKSADVIQGLQHFINTHNVDLLAMLTHRRDILSRIYGSDSMTREMAMYTDIPLLAFHTKQ
ncbi:MAG: universal stress protein, partial [Bacteroidetes bacterium]